MLAWQVHFYTTHVDCDVLKAFDAIVEVAAMQDVTVRIFSQDRRAARVELVVPEERDGVRKHDGERAR